MPDRLYLWASWWQELEVSQDFHSRCRLCSPGQWYCQVPLLLQSSPFHRREQRLSLVRIYPLLPTRCQNGFFLWKAFLVGPSAHGLGSTSTLPPCHTKVPGIISCAFLISYGSQLFQPLGEFLSCYNGKWFSSHRFFVRKLWKAKICTEYSYDLLFCPIRFSVAYGRSLGS